MKHYKEIMAGRQELESGFEFRFQFGFELRLGLGLAPDAGTKRSHNRSHTFLDNKYVTLWLGILTRILTRDPARVTNSNHGNFS